MPAQVSLPILQSIRIAAPCDMRWEDMRGDDRVRHCDACELNVHNISGMTSAETEAFLAERLGQGRVCGVLFQRADGTILTRDCPIGVARWRTQAAWAVGRAAAAVAFLACAVGLGRADSRDRLRHLQPFRGICEWLDPSAVQPAVRMAGKISVRPTPTPTPAPTPPSTVTPAAGSTAPTSTP